VRLAEPLACLAVCLAATPAAAQSASFNIPAGRLSDALIALGQQAGLTIGASEPGLAMVRSRAVRGRMSAQAALARLLDGTGYGFSFVAARTVRIMRVPQRPPRRAPPPPTPPPPPRQPPPAPETEIIVTGSKQGVSLDRFAGTAHLVDLDPTDVGRFGMRGSDAVLSRLPMLASTNLGTGRNKIFIRGVADSSFNGPSQAIVGQYLGDVRLTFNTPDPDLQLYDIRRVEVLEGPQDTLYGTGALGGILRVVPNAPDPSHAAAVLSGGVMTTAHGNPGGDLSGVVNVPLVADRLTLRAVGYGSVEGGYINDAGRNLRDVNRTDVYGGRAALLWTPGNDWRLELSGAAQFIATRDGQYTERGLPRLTRSSTLAQPYDNDYRLGALTIRKRWSGVELMSATSLVQHDLETRFDATGLSGTTGPQLFVEDIGITLFANETRLSRPDARGAGWVIGWSLIYNHSDLNRRLGPPDATMPITGVRNETSEAALFGQYSIPITPRFIATLGGRVTISHSSGSPLDTRAKNEEPTRNESRVSPTVALSWHPADNLLVYGRYQEGFRAGGLAVSGTGSSVSAQRFESDNLASFEAGIRIGRPGAGRFSFNAAVSYARWDGIQADLVDNRGFPFTTNIGDGRIFGLELEGTWRATPRLSFEAAAFINESALYKPDPAFAAADEKDLPNVAGAGGRIAAHYQAPIAQGVTLNVDGAVRYVGRSWLGIGAPLDVRQGGFIESQLGARLDFGRFGLSLDVDNLADSRGNRFAFGNPFGITARNQVTPVRPRTVRLGFDARF
jgi:outer membrane receptor protein involved in Fe transport